MKPYNNDNHNFAIFQHSETRLFHVLESILKRINKLGSHLRSNYNLVGTGQSRLLTDHSPERYGAEGDAQCWKSMLEPQLKTLLEAAGYASVSPLTGRISDLLDNFHAFGPKPTSSVPKWPSFLSDDFSPIEYSISISAKNMIVRFAFEPVSAKSGTESDPVNSRATSKWLSRLVARYPYDLTWLARIRPEMILESAPGIPEACRNLTQQVFAFDMEGDDPRLKVYAMPDAKVRLESLDRRLSRRDEVVDATLKASGFEMTWEPVQKYLINLRETQPALAGYPEALGWDACSPDQARMKVYVRFKEAKLAQVLSHLDLGGALDSEYTREVKLAATEMWETFGAKQLRFDDVANPQDRTGGALLAYELRPGRREPSAVKCESCS